MKKALFSILTAIAAVWMITVGALAAQPGTVGSCGEYACGRGGNYVDIDRDGVCDNCGRKSLHCISQTVLESLRSISKTVLEKCYVDADGDGVCDNYNGWQGNGAAGNGQGGGFVDTDGDGVCDNRTGGQGRGHGNGHHAGRRR